MFNQICIYCSRYEPEIIGHEEQSSWAASLDPVYYAHWVLGRIYSATLIPRWRTGSERNN